MYIGLIFKLFLTTHPQAASLSSSEYQRVQKTRWAPCVGTGAVCRSASLGGYFLARCLSLTFPLSRTEISLSGALCGSKPWDRVGMSSVSACLPPALPPSSSLPCSYISFSKVQLTSPPTSAQDPQWVSVPRVKSNIPPSTSKVLAISPIASLSRYLSIFPTRQSCQLLRGQDCVLLTVIHWIGA